MTACILAGIPLLWSPGSGARVNAISVVERVQHCLTDSEKPDGAIASTEPASEKRLARLVAVVDQLKRRLDTMRGENEQLEGMLHAADSKSAGGWNCLTTAGLQAAVVFHSRRGDYVHI